MNITIDFETRSEAPLKTIGAAAYAAHPSTDVICLAVKRHGSPPLIWYPEKFRSRIPGGYGLPLITDRELRETIHQADEIEAHNMQFEFFMWKYVMARYGFNMLESAKLRCSAAKAAMYGLPRDLAGACKAAGVKEQKDLEGSRLMMKMCKPRRALKEDKLRDPDWEKKAYWHESAAELVRLGQYCLQDVRAEEALSGALPPLPEDEQQLWLLDLIINDRGFAVDHETAAAILETLEVHSGRILKEFGDITGLSSPRQRDATLRHLLALGIEMDGLTSKDVDKALDNAEGDARRILEIRKSLAKSSTSKYKAFLNAGCPDGRMRGTLMYHGAGTGRWTGKLVQPQNFPRGDFSDVDLAIRMFVEGDLDTVNLMYGDPMAAAASCIRGVIVPGEGKEFICADYSAIEGRVLAWLAGEESALQVYRDGRDPYKVAATAIYHVGYEAVDKPKRQVGKTAELACGYQGSVGAFRAMAVNFGFDLPDAEIKGIVDSWRESRPATVTLWRELENACFQAVKNPGNIYTYRGLKFAIRRNSLAMKLPSGRCLWYVEPRIELKDMPWGDKKAVVAFSGVNSVTRKWCTQYLYGGLLAENATQAVARDILVAGVRNVEDAEYPVVLHVHDEALSEVPIGFGSVEEYENLLCQSPAWAAGLPLAAEGWRGRRYRK